MEVVLAYGPPGSGVGDQVIAREIVPRLAGEAFASFWYVAPTLVRRREAEAVTGRAAVPGLFLTVGELLARVSARAVDGMPVLTRAERRALVGACLAEKAMPGLAQAIVRVASELAAAGVRDADALPRGPLERTWRRYRQRLAALGMRDPEERMAVVAAAIESGRVAVPPLVIVEGVPERRLLAALAGRAERLVIVAEQEDVIALARELSARETRLGEASAPVRPRITSYADRRAEVDGIATAVRDANVPPRDIVVAFPALDEYAPLVRERFGRFGIPFELAWGAPLATAPLVRSALALGETVLAGFSRLTVERALASPHVRFGELGYLRIDRYARQAGVVGGGGGAAVSREWIEPLRALQPPTEAAQRFVEKHRGLLEHALSVLAQLETPRPPREAARALLGVWQRFGLARRRTHEVPLEVVAEEVLAWERLVAVVEETARGLALGDVERVDLRELSAAVRAAIADERMVRPEIVRGERVRVIALRDLSGLRAERVFIGGLDEASFPGAPPPALLLGESDRRRLGLPLHEEQVALQRQRLEAALVGARGGADLSFARGELAARDAAATILLDMHADWRDGDAPAGPAAAYTEERRQRLLAHGAAPALAAVGRCPPAALAQTLSAERSRERIELGGWDGSIAEEVSPGLRAAVLADLESRLLGKASVTQLDTYATCPFRFFAARALDLEPLADPLEVDTALTGRLVHAVLCDFYRDARDSELLSGGPAWIAAARPRMRAALERQIERAPVRRDAFFAELSRYLGAGLDGTGVAGLLEAFLACEAAALREHEPVAFELPFGETTHAGPDGDRRLAELVVDVPGQPPVRIAGVIDRVDRLRGSGGAVVFDYKTGRQLPRRAHLAEGYRFQLAVYLAAIAPTMPPAGGGYYRLADAAEIARDLVVGADVAAQVPAAVAHLARAARAGLFAPGHLPPRDKGCSWCDHAVMCRVDHDRLHALSLRRADGVFLPLPLAKGAS